MGYVHGLSPYYYVTLQPTRRNRLRTAVRETAYCTEFYKILWKSMINAWKPYRAVPAHG